MIKDKRKFFCWFVLVICLLGLLFTFIKYSFDMVEEGFYTKPGAITYTSDTVTKWKADASCNELTDDLQKNIGSVGVPEKDVLSYINNKIWPWTDQFTKDFTTVLKLNGQSSDISVKDNIHYQIKTTQATVSEQNLQNIWAYFLGEYTYDKFIYAANLKKLTCKLDPSGNLIGSRMYMLDGSGNATMNTVNNEDLPYLLPGFSFINSPCNPCDIAVNNYDCPIMIPSINGESSYPNSIMQYLWGVGAFASPPQSKNSVPSVGGPAAPTSETKEKPFSVLNIAGF